MRARTLVPGIGLALSAMALYWFAAGRLDPRLADPRAANVWFESDLPYRLDTMTHPGGWVNGGAHPLFPTFSHLLLVAASSVANTEDPWKAARLAGAVCGAAFVLLLYVLFRRMRLTWIDAVLFAAVGAVSAGALFWFPVPETFALAGLGVTFALVVAAGRYPSMTALAAGCAASANSILSNGVVGALALVTHLLPRRRLDRLVVTAFAGLGMMAAVWVFQEWSSATPFFLSEKLFEYRQHLFPVSVERTGYVLQGLLLHPVVAPALRNDKPSFRGMLAFSSGALGVFATLVWIALLVLGAAALRRLARSSDLRPLALTTSGGLAAMLALHLTLGREMFLYAMNVLPLLLVLAAAAARGGRRGLVRGLAVTLLVTAAASNLIQFTRAAAAAQELAVRRIEAGGAAEGR